MIATPILTSELLEQIGNVPEAYQHEWRTASPQDAIVVPGGVFKWYHVHRDKSVIAENVDRVARELIVDGAKQWDLAYGLNFALLHQSVAWAFLIVGIWRGHQELWTRIFVVELAGEPVFHHDEPDGPFTPCACVWEMGVIQHERMAWHRYLFTDRGADAKRAWFDDRYAGVV